MEIERDLHTPICDLLECRYPILQAGMGGVARSELVAAVIEAGGYGFLGMVREPPDLIAREIDKVRAHTDEPFGVNLIPAATDPDLLEAELSVCLKKKVHSLCFFWDVHADVIARTKAAGCRVLYQVGSVEDAVAAAKAGADAIIAQGFEAGGHVRGPCRLWSCCRKSFEQCRFLQLLAAGSPRARVSSRRLRWVRRGFIAALLFSLPKSPSPMTTIRLA